MENRNQPPPFGLLRWYRRTSLLIVISVSLVSGLAATWAVRHAFHEMERGEADSLAEDLVAELDRNGLGPAAWGQGPLPEAAGFPLQAEFDNFGIVDFTLFDRGGSILLHYGPDRSSPSETWRRGFDGAIREEVMLRWRNPRPWALLWLSSSPAGELESYTPVRDGGRVVAVARLRRDLGPALAAAYRTFPVLMLVALLGGVAVFALLQGVVARADRTLREQRQAIDEAMLRLEQQNRLLVELQRRKDDFYAMCSHDLRGPLLNAQAGCRILLGGEPSSTSPEVRAIVLENLRSTASVLDLIENVLDAARIESNVSGPMRRDRLDLRDVTAEVAATHRLLAESGGVRLETDLPRDPLWVEGDRRQLQRIVANLIANAIRHSSGQAVSVKLASRSGQCILEVIDRGPGIPPELQGRIFERFATGGGSGTGLGLTIVREFTESHGGRISVESRPGEGSRFTVTLPASASRP